MEYIVSKKYTDGQTVGRKVAFSSLQNCFDNVKSGSKIFLCDEVYSGKVVLNIPDVTLIGTDESLITYDAYHGLVVRDYDGGDGKKLYGTTGSATFTLKPSATGFKCFNVTFENSHIRIPDASNQAVAYKTESSGGYYENCNFLGRQDTLYVMGVDNIFKECFIIGDVDFIFGSGNTIFDKCIIEMNCKEHQAYITAPNTFVSHSYGFFFYKCRVVKSGNEPAYLGRPWFPSVTEEDIVPRCMFYRCEFPKSLNLEFVKMSKSNSDNYEMYYYKCLQDGKEATNIFDERHIDFYEKIYKEWT